ncbi:MAG: VWA domain-containing protein [Planctomycetota bacterium]
MFLHPELLWGLAALAWPLLLWLLFRRPRQSVRWGAHRLLERAVQRTSRQTSRRRWLLLLLRLAALIALALAAAAPLAREWPIWLGAEGLPTAIVLDDSASMRADDGGTSRFDRARREIVGRLDALPEGTPVGLITTCPPRWRVRPTADRAVLRRQLEELGPGYGRSRWSEVETLLEEAGSPLEVLTWSDGSVPPEISRSVRPVGRSQPNVSIESFEVRELNEEGRVRVIAELRCRGGDVRRGWRLSVDDREEAVGAVQLESGRVVPLEWIVTVPLERRAVLRLELDPDALTADDRAECLSPGRRSLRARLIVGAELPVHVEVALSVLAESAAWKELRWTLHPVSEEPPTDIGDGEVWILAGHEDLSPSWRSSLSAAHSKGAIFHWLLAPEMVPSLQEWIEESFGVTVSELREAPVGEWHDYHLNPTPSPWLAGWGSFEAHRGRYQRAWTLEAAGAVVLAVSSDGAPLVVASERGVFSGLGVDPEDTDLALGEQGAAPLVPLLQSLLFASRPEPAPHRCASIGDGLPGGPDGWVDAGGALAAAEVGQARPGLYHSLEEEGRTLSLIVPFEERDLEVEAASASVEAGDSRLSLAEPFTRLALLLLWIELWLATARPGTGARR